MPRCRRAAWAKPLGFGEHDTDLGSATEPAPLNVVVPGLAAAAHDFDGQTCHIPPALEEVLCGHERGRVARVAANHRLISVSRNEATPSGLQEGFGDFGDVTHIGAGERLSDFGEP